MSATTSTAVDAMRAYAHETRVALEVAHEAYVADRSQASLGAWCAALDEYVQAMTLLHSERRARIAARRAP